MESIEGHWEQSEVDGPTKMFFEGRMTTKGYRLLGSVRASQSRVMTVSPPAGLGRISKFGCGGPLLPVSPPITSTEPFARTPAVLYHLPRCTGILNDQELQNAEWKHLKFEKGHVLFPIIRSRHTLFSVGSVQADTESGI